MAGGAKALALVASVGARRDRFSIGGMKRFAFSLNFSAQQYLPYYRGSVSKVVARCDDGSTVQFPAGLLTPFVTTAGVHGNFVLVCGDDGKGARLERR